MKQENDTTIFELFKTLFIENDQEKVKKMVETVVNALMVAEREQFIGAGPYERKEKRNGQANGYKEKGLNTTRFGTLELLHPQVRGTAQPFHSGLFERYQRSEKALFIAAAEMYYKGVSTRKIRDLFEDVFETKISPQFVSTAAKQIDEEIQAWKREEIREEIPYLIMDALYVKVREGYTVKSVGVLIVAGITRDRRRRVLVFEVADLESYATWKEVFRKLKERGLKGVVFIVSDAHEGLKSAIKEMFHGGVWQRCKVHLMRNFLYGVKKKEERKNLMSYLKKAYESRSREEAMKEIERGASYLREQGHWKLAVRLSEEFEESIQYMALPESHWKRMATSNFMERINSELKRRINAIRIFPNRESAERLIGALLLELDEEWRYGRKYLDMGDKLGNRSDEANSGDDMWGNTLINREKEGGTL